MKQHLFVQASGLAILALAATGCGPALNPFFTASSLHEDPGLAGHWTPSSRSEEAIEIRHLHDSNYRLVHTQDGQEDSYPATLFRVGGSLFLDFQEKTSGAFSSAIHPHGLLRLHRRGDTVEVSELDTAALELAIEQKRLGLASVRLDSKTFLLTAPSSKLEQFLARHGLDPQFWSAPETYRRAHVEQGTSN